MATSNQSITFGDIAIILKRRVAILVLCVAAGALLAAAADSVLPQSYEATASVAVSPLAVDTSPTLPAADQLLSMPTEQQVISSAAVARLSLTKLQPRISMTPQQLLRAYVVTVPKDSRVLTVTATSPNATHAAMIANTVAQSYLSVRATTAAADLSASIKDTKKRLKELTSASKPDSDIEQRSLQVQADAMSSRLVALNNSTINPGSVIATATPPSGSTRPGLRVLAISGMFLGLLAGGTWVIMTAGRHERVENAARLEPLGGLAVIDGSEDSRPHTTWDRIALILDLPESIGENETYFVAVDGPESMPVPAGRELAAAGRRLGFDTDFFDGSKVSLARINQGWPNRQATDWGGKVLVIDTSSVVSEAHRVILLDRADAVLLARRAKDDLARLRRFVDILHARNTPIDVIALTPAPRSWWRPFPRRRTRQATVTQTA